MLNKFVLLSQLWVSSSGHPSRKLTLNSLWDSHSFSLNRALKLHGIFCTQISFLAIFLSQAQTPQLNCSSTCVSLNFFPLMDYTLSNQQHSFQLNCWAVPGCVLHRRQLCSDELCCNLGGRKYMYWSGKKHTASFPCSPWAQVRNLMLGFSFGLSLYLKRLNLIFFN